MLKLVHSSVKNTVFLGGFFVSALSLLLIKLYKSIHETLPFEQNLCALHFFIR